MCGLKSPTRVISTRASDGRAHMQAAPHRDHVPENKLPLSEVPRGGPAAGRGNASQHTPEEVLALQVLARISHRIECIRAANQRKPLCDNHFSPNRGAPGCPRNVSRICLDLNLLKDARWWRRSTLAAIAGRPLTRGVVQSMSPRKAPSHAAGVVALTHSLIFYDHHACICLRAVVLNGFCSCTARSMSAP
jgi:hypothetical protein